VRVINLRIFSTGCQFSLWSGQVAFFNWACKSSLLAPWALLRWWEMQVGVVRPLRQQIPKGCNLGTNVNALNNKKFFSRPKFCKILRKITRNSINNCEILKFKFSVRGGCCDYSPLAPKHLATTLFCTTSFWLHVIKQKYQYSVNLLKPTGYVFHHLV